MATVDTALTAPKKEVPAVRGTEPAALVLPDKRSEAVVSAESARTEAIAGVLAGAYEQASRLKLTDAESKALYEPFLDESIRTGAKGKDNLLYICHIHVSDRLNRVLGVGQWALMRRSQRAEECKSQKGEPMVRIYYEGVLLIRGVFAAESVGEGTYHLNNPNEDFSSALESSMSDCLTRCAKRLGIGSQVWDKSFCDQWLKAHVGGTASGGGAPKELFKKKATAAEASTPAPGESTVTVGLVEAIKLTPEGGVKPHGIKLADNSWHSTYDLKIIEAAKEAKKLGQEVQITDAKTDKGYVNIVSLVNLREQPPEPAERQPGDDDDQGQYDAGDDLPFN